MDESAYTILLMGETGTGKSTFINALLNYLSFTNLKEAEKSNLKYLVPTQFTVTNENYQTFSIKIGESSNERQIVGKSATTEPKCYNFKTRKGKIQIIDTPGLGDTEGMEQDNINFENILEFISQFKEINAICILLKPNESRTTLIFEYCLKHLLSRLEKDASKNIIFIFTNSKSTSYKPGESIVALKKILEHTETQPPFVKIPFGKDNIYSVDSEAFRYLATIKSNVEVEFTDVQKLSFNESWEKSSNECDRLLEYIESLVSHKIQDTITINEARKLIMHLSQPLADTLEMIIQENLTALEYKKKELSMHTGQIEELRKSLLIPVADITVNESVYPRTICMSPKCSSRHQLNHEDAYHQPEACCDPCLIKFIPLHQIGASQLLFCDAMLIPGDLKDKIFKSLQNLWCKIIDREDAIICSKCGCSYTVHSHVYYHTQKTNSDIQMKNLQDQLKTKEDAKNVITNCIKEIELRAKVYEDEQNVINLTLAEFDYFLRSNSIAPYSDNYQNYLESTLTSEQEQENPNRRRIKIFKNMLKLYKKEKEKLQDRIKSCRMLFNANSVNEAALRLFNLKHCGQNIHRMCQSLKSARYNLFLKEIEIKS